MTHKPFAPEHAKNGLEEKVKEREDKIDERDVNEKDEKDVKESDAKERKVKEWKVAKREREPWMNELLSAIKQKDRAYDYHLPPNIIENYDDDALRAYLEETFSRSHFIMETPSEIARYLQPGDKVFKKGDYQEIAYTISYGSKGVVKKVWAEQKKADVKFKSIKEAVRINFSDLGGIGHQFFSWTYVSYVFSHDAHEENMHALWECDHCATPGTKVKYYGSEIVKHRVFVPDGTEGIVVGFNQIKDERKIAIAWANAPNLIYEIPPYYYHGEAGLAFRGFHPAAYFKEQDITLAIPNTLDVKQLLGALKPKKAQARMVDGEIESEIEEEK